MPVYTNGLRGTTIMTANRVRGKRLRRVRRTAAGKSVQHNAFDSVAIPCRGQDEVVPDLWAEARQGVCQYEHVRRKTDRVAQLSLRIEDEPPRALIWCREPRAVLAEFGVELPESDDYDTVAGFVSATLGRIPEPGEAFEHANARIEIVEAEPTRVLTVRVTTIPVREDEPAPAK